MDAVNADRIRDAYLLTSHLIERRHRKIAFISRYHHLLYNEDAYSGFRKVFIENNIDISNIFFAEAPASLQGAYDAMKRIFRQGKKPSAALCHCPAMARGVMKAAREKGMRIPEDFSIEIGRASCRERV